MTAAARWALLMLIALMLGSGAEVVARCKAHRRRNCCVGQPISRDRCGTCCGGMVQNLRPNGEGCKHEGHQKPLALKLREVPEGGQRVVELEVTNVGKVAIAF